MKRLAAHRTHYCSMTYLWFTLPILIFLNKNIPIIIICLACISSFLEQWQHHMCLKILLNWGCFFLNEIIWHSWLIFFSLICYLFIFIYLLKCFVFRNKFSWKDTNQNTKRREKTGIKNPKTTTTTTTKKWINLDYIQKFNKKWKL